MFKILFLFLVLFSSVFAVDLESFTHELLARRSKVAEFKLLQTEAQKLGIKHVYLFGGTATAYARYVKEDLDRMEGAPYQKERFDYEYESIFRSEQDMDIVIDGTSEDAARLQARMQELAPHFIGEGNSKTVWEVRLLNEKNGDKESLLGFDFQNQHSDSYSTGLIDLMDCESFDCIKDVRAFNEKISPFLKDVFHNEISFYYSPKHFQTARYLGGLNPEILSVIRYYTKVVQYDAKSKKSDILKLQSIIDHFDKSIVDNSKPYVKTWIEKNAKKLMVNAVDMESAQKIITQNNLKEKIITLGNKDIPYSTAWYLNKSALPTKPLGTTGKTAREIFGKEEIIVTHDTKSLAAYESLMKAKPGYVNAWQSRKGVDGESAGSGDGFYVLEGTRGIFGGGIPVHMKLNPNARYGEDFIKSGNEIIIINRAALTVIPQSLSGLSFNEMLDLLFNPQSIFKDNEAVKFLLTKKIKQKRARKEIPALELQMAIKKIDLNKMAPRNVVFWLGFDQQLDQKIFSYIDAYITEGKGMHYFIQEVLANAEIIKHPKFVTWINISIANGKGMNYLAKYILSQPFIIARPEYNQWLMDYIEKGSSRLELAQFVLSTPEAINHPQFKNWIKMYLARKSEADWEYLYEEVFSKPAFKNKYGSLPIFLPNHLTSDYLELIKSCNDFFKKII